MTNETRAPGAPAPAPIPWSAGVPVADATGVDSRFRTMADHAPVLLWMTGQDAMCAFFNQTWLRFTGRTMDQEVGLGWAEGVHPEDFQHCVSTFMTAFVERRAFSMEYRLRRHDGEYRWILDCGAPHTDQEGVFRGFIGSCVDITDQRAARDALQQLNGELTNQVRERTALVEAREELLREVHHRVKNDLQLVASLLRMHGREADELAVREVFDQCERRIHGIARVHEFMYQSDDLTLLDFSSHLTDLIDNLAPIAPRGVKVVRSIAPQLRLEVDKAIPSSMILHELLTNAMRHAFPQPASAAMPARTGTIRVTCQALPDGERLQLSVIDDGVGMSTEQESRRTLGWTLVRALAAQVGGELKVASTNGTRVDLVMRMANTQKGRDES